MKCILIEVGTRESEIIDVGETLRVKDYYYHNGIDYIVEEIVIEPNQKHPLVYCKKELPRKKRKPLVVKWS